MKFSALYAFAIVTALPVNHAFTPSTLAVRTPTALNVAVEEMTKRDLKQLVKANFPDMGFIKRQSLGKNKMIDLLSTVDISTTPFPKAVEAFPGAMTNKEVIEMIGSNLDKAGYDKQKTLVACSLCCDEVNRPLERELSAVYTDNFNMGGLAGFPFGGAVAFGAMAAHIPDGGSTLMVYGPHVGVDSTGAVGTVERRMKANGGSCCGSAVAASGYVAGVLSGDTEKATIPDDPIAAQQAYVGDMLLPHAQRLEDADCKMTELPYALYDAQTEVVDAIISKAAGGVAGDGKIGVLGGIQINTPEDFSDYFLPKSFTFYDNKGKVIEKVKI